MKVSGFTFIRNAVEGDFPFEEAVSSVIPICDEFIIVDCESTDGTQNIIEKLKRRFRGKIKVFRVPWRESRGNWIYSRYANLAFSLCSGDWCFYIQADEVVPEYELGKIKLAMDLFLEDDEVEAIALKFLHFFGSYGWIRTDRRWYEKELRIFKGNLNFVSFSDAQTFGVGERRRIRRPRAVVCPAYVFHYGWVRKPRLHLTLHCKREWLSRFTGKHPDVMKKRIKGFGFDFSPERCFWNPTDKKDKIYTLKMAFERMTGLRLFTWKTFDEIREKTIKLEELIIKEKL